MSKNFKRAVVAVLLTALLFAAMLNPLEAVKGDSVNNVAAGKLPKYMFLFIGDGMAHVQAQAAQVYQGTSEVGKIALKRLNFTNFPVSGVATTHDSTSFCPDSASTATSISAGVKTHSGVIGLTQDKKTKVKTIAEYAKENGKKVGVISTVTLNHATPAAFYANVESRGDYYEIGKQMADSNFDYFAGGSLGKRTGKNKDQKDLFEVMKEKGYKITETKKDFEKINNKTGKVYAVAERLPDGGAMPYCIDETKNDISLKQFVDKGIEVLDNEKGFFMMVESGKIDWACHANDAASAVKEVLGLTDAVQSAIDFYNKHPEDTLIIVTGDHETGGMTIGQSATGYETAFEFLRNQKMSYEEMDNKIKAKFEANPNLKFEDIVKDMEAWTGLKIPAKPVDESKFSYGEHEDMNVVLTAYEVNLLKKAFEQTKKIQSSEEYPEDEMATQENYNLYGFYEPLSVTLTHILNNKAGLGWTSYSHTGVPEAVYAIGATSDIYGGYYDNTDIFNKMMSSFGYTK